MRFSLIDRIVELQPGKQITAVKNLSLAEEYLADHFPRFPVMPGVLMLEAMTQTAAWLVRVTEDFAHSIVVLHEARTVKFADFVAPGQALTVQAEMLSHEPRRSKLKVQASVTDRVNVSARLVLARYNLAEAEPSLVSTDTRLTAKMRELFALLYRPASQRPSEPLVEAGTSPPSDASQQRR
jgi:3-hydroxyacyl-[acyl-carrier-protein] dehydratase